MVCKQCGTNNEVGSEYCATCGAPLAQADAAGQPSSWGFVQPPSWPKPTFDINKVDELPVPEPVYTPPVQQPAPPPQQQVYRAPSVEAGYTYAADDGGQLDAEQPQDTAFRPKTVASVGDYENTGAYNTGSFGRMPRRPDYEDREDTYSTSSRNRGARAPARSGRGNTGLNKRPASRRPRSSGSSYRGGGTKRNTMIFIGAAALLVVMIIVFAIIILNKNFGGVGGFFRTVFGGSAILKPVETDETIVDGAEMWQITVFTRAGNTVTMRVGDREKSDVVNSSNQKLLYVPKSMLMPDTPWDSPTAELAPEVTITTKDGETVPVEIPPFTVNVPALNLNVTTPQGSAVAVSRNKVTFAGTVDAADVEVSVQGQPLTVNPDGTFTGEYELAAVGSHSLTVEAKKPGYQIAKATFQVDYSQSEAYINVDRTTIRAAADGDVAKVKGQIDAGATMTATCADTRAVVGTPTVNADGTFEFSVTMSEVGAYTIDVNISKDGRSTSGIIEVERAPVLNTYSAAAYKVNYARMMDEPTHTGSYKCIGTVTEVMQDEPFHIARLKTTDGDIIFEYHNVAAKVEVGDGLTYNIFGDYIGKDEETGLPLVYCWFIIKEK